MLRELPISHLHFRVSLASKAMTPSTGIGVLTNKIGGENVVVSVEPTSDANIQGIRPGDIILTSNDVLRGPWGSSTNIEVKHCNQQIEESQQEMMVVSNGVNDIGGQNLNAPAVHP